MQKSSQKKKSKQVVFATKPRKPKQPKYTPFADAGGTMGRALGGMFGVPFLGSGAGRFLGGAVGKIFGSGAYKMKGGNSSWNTTSQVPIMHSQQDSIIFSHREYLGEVHSSTGFTIQRRVAVNPGISSSFPYLGPIAQNFSEYKFRGLVYEFKSTSADALNSTNTALGTVMMSAQYNADAPPPSGKLELLNEMWSADGKPSQNLYLPIECAPAENPMSILYTRGSDAPPGDQKWFDLAAVTIATSGSQAVAVIGELWVTYEVELKKPKMSNTSGALAGNSWSYSSVLATTAIPLGVQIRKVAYGVDCTVDANAGKITFPAHIRGSRFYVFISYVATTTVTAVVPTVVGLGLIGNWLYDPVLAQFSQLTELPGSGSAVYTSMYLVEVDTDQQATYTVGNTIVGTASVDIKIIQVSDEQY